MREGGEEGRRDRGGGREGDEGRNSGWRKKREESSKTSWRVQRSRSSLTYPLMVIHGVYSWGGFREAVSL